MLASLRKFRRRLDRSMQNDLTKNLELVIFPETYQNIQFFNILVPSRLGGNHEVKSVLGRAASPRRVSECALAIIPRGLWPLCL